MMVRMERRTLRNAVLALALHLTCAAAAAASLHIVFINPGRADEPFWRSVTRFMQPAARQLDIDLEVLYADRDHVQMAKLAREVAGRREKPDYLILVNEKRAAGDMLKTAEEAGIKTLLAFSTFEDSQAAEFGEPRRQYPHWLGAITPNAREAGQLSAQELVRQAIKSGRTDGAGKVHVALVAGDKVTPTGVQRLDGALAALKANHGVVVEQIVHAGWERERARQNVRSLLLRYPALDAIWCASDLMAYGGMDAATALGRHPGKDLLFSAFNNSPEVLNKVVSGQLAALAGGHFTMGAWALVMLYDYHHGRDFAPLGLRTKPAVFSLIDARMAQRFLDRFGNEDFSSVDFRRYSRHLHRQLQQYDFSLATLLD